MSDTNIEECVTTRRAALGLGATAVAGAALGGSKGLAAPLATTSIVRGQCTALGWYVLFAHPTTQAAMERHHADGLNLPLFRRWRLAPGQIQSKDHFWLGEAVILDLSYQGQILGERARQLPIMRVDNVDAAVGALRGRGVATTRPVDGVRGREAFIDDPMGQQIGLREAPRHSPLPADREARRRAARGEAFNPGCASMPVGWRELGWVQVRAADPKRLAQFYGDVLGLRLIDRRRDSILFDLGDSITLEIVGGGLVRPAPPAQYAATAAIILRVDGLAALSDRVKRAGIEDIGHRYSNLQNDWYYVADPEGNVVGFSEWRHPSVYAAKIAPVPTDLEAQRRSVEAKALVAVANA